MTKDELIARLLLLGFEPSAAAGVYCLVDDDGIWCKVTFDYFIVVDWAPVNPRTQRVREGHVTPQAAYNNVIEGITLRQETDSANFPTVR